MNVTLGGGDQSHVPQLGELWKTGCCVEVTMEEEVMDAESSSGLHRKSACSHVVTEQGRGRRIFGAAVLKGSASWSSVLKDLWGVCTPQF